MKKINVKVLSKCKNKRNLCIFIIPYHEVPYSWYKVHMLTRSYKKKSSDSGDYVTIPNGFSQFWQYFEKKPFLSGVIVSVNRRRNDIKGTLMQFINLIKIRCNAHKNNTLKISHS